MSTSRRPEAPHRVSKHCSCSSSFFCFYFQSQLYLVCVLLFLIQTTIRNPFQSSPCSYPINVRTNQPGTWDAAFFISSLAGPWTPCPGKGRGKHFLASVQTCSLPTCPGSWGLLRLRREDHPPNAAGPAGLGKMRVLHVPGSLCPNRNHARKCRREGVTFLPQGRRRHF